MNAVALVAYPGTQEAAVFGLRDLLETAARLGEAPLEVAILTPPELPARPLSAVILPPCLGATPTGDETLRAWLLTRHREGALLCSVCAGAFLLAETGLLARRPATTHWALHARFAERFPEVRLNTDRLLVDEGDLITAGGVMAWVDLGLRLIARLVGPSAMLATARHFIVDPGEREQRFYALFSPRFSHGDEPILKVQRWLQTQGAKRVSLNEMAAQAGLTERTLLRRFQEATGFKPTEYVQHLRIARARELLELSATTVEEVAWRVGYEDPGAFRKVFVRLMGLTPGEYRKRFSSLSAKPQASDLGTVVPPVIGG